MGGGGHIHSFAPTSTHTLNNWERACVAVITIIIYPDIQSEVHMFSSITFNQVLPDINLALTHYNLKIARTRAIIIK